MSGLVNSEIAISAAFFMDCAASPAFPAPDNGRRRPTLTCPVPIAVGCWAGGGGAPLQKLLPGNPEQPARKTANASICNAWAIARGRGISVFRDNSRPPTHPGLRPSLPQNVGEHQASHGRTSGESKLNLGIFGLASPRL